MALNRKPRIIKKGEPRRREEKPRRQVLMDERRSLLVRVREIEKELQTA